MLAWEFFWVTVGCLQMESVVLGVSPVMKVIFAEKSSLIITGNSNLFAKNGGGVLQGQNSLATQLVVEFAAC